MKHFLLWRCLMFQTKFSYLTPNHGRGGQQVLEISAPTGGASGYLQAHLASAGRVGRGRRAGGGGCKGVAKTLLSVGTRTRRCNQGGITHSPLHMGVSRPPPPSSKGSSSKILPAGIGAIISTLHNCDRCFFYGLDPALTGLYPERGEGGGQLVIDNINF